MLSGELLSEAIGDDGAKLQRPRRQDDLMLCCLFPNLFG